MKQTLEEIELAQMEEEQIADIGADDDDGEDDDDPNGAHYDSPYPSDDEDEEEEFVVTSTMNDSSIRSDNESVVLVSELSNRLDGLKAGSMSPVVDRFETSTPTPPCHYDHCGCIACTICTDCGVCKFCLICFTCGDCHYDSKEPSRTDENRKNDDATVKNDTKNDDATVKEQVIRLTVSFG